MQIRLQLRIVTPKVRIIERSAHSIIERRSLAHFLLQLLHGFIQYPLISLVTQVSNETRLFCSEHISRATDIQVLHRQVEPCTQFGEGTQCLQSPTGVLSQQFLRRRYQVAVSLSVASSDTTTQLMQVSQSVFLGGENEYRVHIRDVHTRLDDGGRNEDIVVVVDERLQPLFHLLCRQLTMRDDDACLGAQTPNTVLDAWQHLDAVVHDEHLSIAS